jgi:hypothetical protein
MVVLLIGYIMIQTYANSQNKALIQRLNIIFAPR